MTMKKAVILTFLATILLAFILGMEFNSWYYNIDSLYKANKFKMELVDTQAKALESADSLISKHNLYDADSSDLMDSYMEKYNKVDSLYKTQR